MRTPIEILLVEDDDGDAYLVQEGLAEAAPSMALRRAQTLADAERMAVDGVDCVLLDLGLPDTQDARGIDAVRRIRAVAPHVAVVVLTGIGDRLGLEAVAAGAQDYLVKGEVEPDVLARAISYAFERRHAEIAEQELLEARLQARENARLERGLLPTALVRDPLVKITSDSRPGRQRSLLGGDFYDAVELADGTLHVMIGDVCGHGADEAALGASLRIAWRALTMAGHSPEEVVLMLNEMLPHERHAPDIFATLCTLTVHPSRDFATLRLAGHPPPLLLDGDRVTALDVPPSSPPLGLFEHLDRPGVDIELGSKWSVLLYTDGLVEGRVGEGPERLGDSRLVETVERHIRDRPGWRDDGHGLLHAIISEVEELNRDPLTDDLAVVLVSSLDA